MRREPHSGALMANYADAQVLPPPSRGRPGTELHRIPRTAPSASTNRLKATRHAENHASPNPADATASGAGAVSLSHAYRKSPRNKHVISTNTREVHHETTRHFRHFRTGCGFRPWPERPSSRPGAGSLLGLSLHGQRVRRRHSKSPMCSANRSLSHHPGMESGVQPAGHGGGTSDISDDMSRRDRTESSHPGSHHRAVGLHTLTGIAR